MKKTGSVLIQKSKSQSVLAASGAHWSCGRVRHFAHFSPAEGMCASMTHPGILIPDSYKSGTPFKKKKKKVEHQHFKYFCLVASFLGSKRLALCTTWWIMYTCLLLSFGDKLFLPISKVRWKQQFMNYLLVLHPRNCPVFLEKSKLPSL